MASESHSFRKSPGPAWGCATDPRCSGTPGRGGFGRWDVRELPVAAAALHGTAPRGGHLAVPRLHPSSTLHGFHQVE